MNIMGISMYKMQAAGWNFADCQEICRLTGKSNVRGQNLRVCRFLLVLKNKVFLLVIVAKHKSKILSIAANLQIS